MADEIIDLTSSPPPPSRPRRSPKVLSLRTTSGNRVRARRVPGPIWFSEVDDWFFTDPFIETNAAPFSSPEANPNYESRIPTETEVILIMGLITYDPSEWGKMARNFTGNNTPQQVPINAESFFELSNMNPTNNATNIAADPAFSADNNLMAAPTLFFDPVAPNEPLSTFLSFFSEEIPSFPVPPPAGECGNNNHGIQMLTCAASNLMDVEDEVDLELSLG